MKNVLITGGTGFIGQRLTQLLIHKGYTVSILSRNKKENLPLISYFTWDVDHFYIEENAVLNADFIIHLAGEGIAEKRWTLRRKAKIVSSREDSVALIRSIFEKNSKSIEAFITASGIGIYGAENGSEIYTEKAPISNDFLGETCQKWEVAADSIQKFSKRIVKIRTGLVLGKNAPLLNKLAPIFKLKLGSALGSGNQYMPWIHVDDLCAIYLEAIENDALNGVYNAAVLDNTTNTIFSKTLAKIYGYKIWLPNIPEFVLKLVLGEMATIILKGKRVSSGKIQSIGFEFKHTDLEQTLKKCI